MLQRPAILLAWPALSATGAPAGPTDDWVYEPFGTLTLYRPADEPRGVVLFLSGDGGWNQGVVDMATSIRDLGALVVGLDVNHYRTATDSSRTKCTSLAADLEMLSHRLQAQLDLPTYTQPILIGYSSGATLVYAALAQAPSGTFRGAISLGFCPDVPLRKSLCRGELLRLSAAAGNAALLSPSPGLDTPWAALQGDVDEVCSAATTADFAAGIPRAQLIPLPRVGHGFSVQKNWMPQFKRVFRDLVDNGDPSAPNETLGDPPLVELPASAGEWLAVIVSGDGGWAGLDKSVGAALAGAGIAVIGLNSLKYFWKPKTPEQAGADLGRILRTYSSRWNRHRLLVVGYSFGADVVPFMVDRLPADIRLRTEAVVLIGAGPEASFEFHVTDWVGKSSAGRPLLPALQGLTDVALLCLHGAAEHGSLCPTLPEGLARDVQLPGDHHYDGDYARIAREIIAFLTDRR